MRHTTWVGANHFPLDVQAEILIANKAFDADDRASGPLTAAGYTETGLGQIGNSTKWHLLPE
jgi:hypothetical protein